MVYLFFLFSLVSPFLFISPKNFHAPFQKGVFLFSSLLLIISFWKEKKSKNKLYPTDWLPENQITLLPYLLCLSCIAFLLSSTYHAIHLTKAIADSFLFQDADYIGISDILLSVAKGDGFTSAYYSDSGQGSYLHHHFAPGMAILSPFVSLIPSRWGLAVGVFFLYQLATILWLLWAYRITKENPKEFGIKFLLFWVLLTNQLYLYRIGSSYHFEVLVVLFGLFFFYLWEKRKKRENLHSFYPWIYNSFLALTLVLYLIQKEDIGIYIILFFLPSIFHQFYRLWKKSRIGKLNSGLDRDDSLDKKNLKVLCLVFSIIFLWLGFVFFIYPMFGEKNNSVSWTQVLTQEYHVVFKQVTGVQKSFQIFLEFIVSGGIGIFQMIPEVLGIGLVYATHLFSSRPWHHEVYTYYSYTLLPFVLYTGILWIQSEKRISVSFAFLILACLFWKNSLDQNFPLNTKRNNPWTSAAMQEEIRSDLQEANQIFFSQYQNQGATSLEQEKTNRIPQTKPHPTESSIKNTDGIFVFSQYNLSFFVSDKAKTYPLEQIKNAETICKNANLCYAVFAPEFTDEILWPKSRILVYRKEWENQQGELVWKGKQLEVWKRESLPKKTK